MCNTGIHSSVIALIALNDIQRINTVEIAIEYKLIHRDQYQQQGH